MHLITKGATSQSIDIFIQDSASSTGGGKTGLAYNTSDLTAYYRRGGTGAATAITLATLANAAAAWSSGGFVEIDATNMPGWYRLDIPDAALATGVDRVGIHLKGASGMAPVPIGITLTAVDLQITPGSAGGLFIAGANAATSINSSTGDALTLSSTGGNGAGLKATAHGTGAGIAATGGATGPGLKAAGGSTSGTGIEANGSGYGHGVSLVSGDDGGVGLKVHSVWEYGAWFTSGGSHAIVAEPLDFGSGMVIKGGVTGGDALFVSAIGAIGNGAVFQGVVDSHGIKATGFGVGAGLQVEGGAAGPGFRAKGGATGGAGAEFIAQAGNSDGATFVKSGTGKDINGVVAADMISIAGLTRAATKLSKSADTISYGTCASGAAHGSGVTTIPTSSLTPAAAVTDQFKGLVLAFDESTATAALRGQKCTVTTSSSGGVFTVTQLTTLPASGDVFTVG